MSEKKSTSFIAKTKNRLENLKQDHVPFQLPRNLLKKHGNFILFFQKDFRLNNLIFPFMHRVSASILSLLDSTTKNCSTCNFSLQYQYILQQTVLENKETYQLDGVKLMRHFPL